MGHLSTQRPFFRKKKISLASFCNGNPNESTHHFSVSWGNHMAGRWPLPNTHLFLQEGVSEVGRALPWASGLSPHSSPSEELGTVRVTLTLDASVYPYVKWRVSPLDLQGPSTLKFYALGFNPLYKLVGGFGQPPVFLQGRRSKNTSTRSQETQKWGAKVREGLQKRKAGWHFFRGWGVLQLASDGYPKEADHRTPHSHRDPCTAVLSPWSPILALHPVSSVLWSDFSYWVFFPKRADPYWAILFRAKNVKLVKKRWVSI